MEKLTMPDGEIIPMNTVLCVTSKPGHIHVVFIENHEVLVADWAAFIPSQFIRELQRLQTDFMEYLNRKGIPPE